MPAVKQRPRAEVTARAQCATPTDLIDRTSWKLWHTSLPSDIRDISSTPLFKKKLKTYLFSVAYPAA